MARFSGVSTRASARGLSPALTTSPTLTHEGGVGWTLDDKAALFSLAVTSRLSGSFYGDGKGEQDRLVSLTRKVAAADPLWLTRFIPWVRTAGLMRTAATVMAVEYCAIPGVPLRRQTLASALRRADEPLEAWGYWLATRGRKTVPAPMKRALCDAARALWTESSTLKWDRAKGVRMGDLVRMMRPVGKAPWQEALFTALVGKTAGVELDLSGLSTWQAHATLGAVPVAQRSVMIGRSDIGSVLHDAGMTWESVSGWLQGPMTAQAWQAILPSMGYMARLRNLRNFVDVALPDEALGEVLAGLCDPDAVASSRQFPFSFFQAHKATAGRSYRVADALERAAVLACANIPALPGSTCIAVDVSASMGWAGGDPSRRVHGANGAPWEQAAFFGAVLARRNPGCRLVMFGTHTKALTDRELALSPFAVVERIGAYVGTSEMGSGTNIAGVFDHARGFDRLMILSDLQIADRLPGGFTGPIYMWDLGGHGTTLVDLGSGRHHLAGLSDAAFTTIPLLERGADVSWDDLFEARSSTWADA